MNHLSKIFDLMKEVDAQFVDFRFTDMRGVWHHLSAPIAMVDEKLFQEGLYFDGSSISGWCDIHMSDMLLMPDLTQVCVDPFAAQSSIIIFCDVYDPVTNKPYNRDPRSIAKKAEAYLIKSGLADTAYFGPEAEFFIFDSVKYGNTPSDAFFELYADEQPESNAHSESGFHHGHRPCHKQGYFPAPPVDSLSDLRAEMSSNLEEMGIVVEKHHHEVAPCQHEIGIQYSTLVDIADKLQIYKYAIKNTAHSYGKTATFMAKPIFGDNGSGMHVHQSLWGKSKPLFLGNEYAGLSKLALYYIGGIIKYAPAINAFTNPTTNSYKRLVPGYEAPIILGYSARNRSVACRIPLISNPNGRRVEVRFADPTANSYLAFSAMLLAGLEGIKNKIHPGDALQGNLFEQVHDGEQFPTVSRSLRDALEQLSGNRQFLTNSKVFDDDFIDAYIEEKMKEVEKVDITPNPMEFQLYYGA